WPDDDEIDLPVHAKSRDGLVVGNVEWDKLGLPGNARIARRGVELRQQRRRGQLPRQRMLAAARSDQKYIHAVKPVAGSSCLPVWKRARRVKLSRAANPP